VIAIFLFVVSLPLFGQDIVTAERYLEMVSQRYTSIQDYEAKINIRSGTTEMTGTVAHVAPSFLRLDFTRPANQVIVFNGDQLTVYLPEYQAVLNQAVTEANRNSSASLATARGLSMLRRNYTTSYLTGPDSQPLETGSKELVIKLKLSRRSSSEGFRELTLSIDPETYLIRRIEGRTVTDTLVRFDFSAVKINQGIPEQRFMYDSPSSASMYNNFLFRNQ
jgi:outer membrane lipoprotein-sorting protein